MNERENNAAITFLAAGAAAGLTLTYIARASRARMRKSLTQAVTIVVPRDRIERFVEDRERMLRVLQSKRLFSNIERLEVRDAPGNRGSEVYLSMRGTAKYGIKEILRRMKALLECGEIPTAGRRA